MNSEEALIYLPIDNENDAHDLYDEKLFELKQFFLNRFPMSKVINARMSKFSKIEDAYVALGGELPEVTNPQIKSYPSFDSIHELYKWYNLEKNSVRLQLSLAKSLKEIWNALNEYVRLTREFATYWQVPVDESDQSIIKLSVEPNPMDIQTALNALSDQEKLNSEYIFTLPDENCLKSEAKRLSLWLNFENNE